MPLVLGMQVDIRDGLRRCRFQGEVDDESLVDSLRRLWTDAGYDPSLPELYDFRGIHAGNVTTQGLSFGSA